MSHESDLRRLADAIDRAATEAIAKAGITLAELARGRIGLDQADWPPLADSTVAAKQAAGETGRLSETDPLYATGALRDGIGSEVDAGDPHVVRVGTADPTAVYHEHGTARMPPRPLFAPVAASHAGEIADAVRAAIGSAISAQLDEMAASGETRQ